LKSNLANYCIAKVTHTISIFNTMFASSVTGCPPNSDLGRRR